MSHNNFHTVVRNGFATKQIALSSSEITLASHASDLLKKQIGSEIGVPVEKEINLQEAIEKHKVILETMRLLAAEQKIKEKYEQIGNKFSPLGLQVDQNLGVQSFENTYFMDFRGGRIVTTLNNNEAATALKMREVEIWWTGLECRVRQEKVDEVYGSVSALIPGTGMSNVHKFPGDREYWGMGPDGQRIIQVGVLMYKGPPMNITLIASLVEHDSGNIDEYKKRISEVITKAAQGLAASAGVPAEALAADQGFINDLSGGLVNAVSSAVGADDDEYVPQQLILYWPQLMGAGFPKQTLRRDDDAHVIDYTHVIPVSGTDQGGDRGEYGFYFNIKSYDTIPVEAL